MKEDIHIHIHIEIHTVLYCPGLSTSMLNVYVYY